MPRNSKQKRPQGRPGKGRDANGLEGSDDEFNVNDAASIISNNSSGGSNFRDEDDFGGANSGRISDELTADGESVEEKIKEDMEMAAQKSGDGRTAALIRLTGTLSRKHLPDFVDTNKLTLADLVDKAMKRGKAKEQIAAANLALALSVSLGDVDRQSAEEMYKELKPTFVVKLLDPAVASGARSAAANALATMCFIASDDISEFPALMDTFEKVFKPSTNVDAAVKFTEDTLALHTAAISAWTLIATRLSPFKGLKLLEAYISVFSALLESTNVDLRIATGEAVAVLFELALATDEEDEALSLVDILLPQLKQLSTDSHKYRSKKDRKEQKSSFRDILKFIEGSEELDERVNFNSRESLFLESWAEKKQYDTLCKALTSGMNLHLTENELVRDIFGLGSPIPAASAVDPASKLSKQQRNNINQQNFKVRSQARGKHRDKRSTVVM